MESNQRKCKIKDGFCVVHGYAVSEDRKCPQTDDYVTDLIAMRKQ